MPGTSRTPRRECAALLSAERCRCRPTTSASRRATCSTCWMRAASSAWRNGPAYIGRVRGARQGLLRRLAGRGERCCQRTGRIVYHDGHAAEHQERRGLPARAAAGRTDGAEPHHRRRGRAAQAAGRRGARARADRPPTGAAGLLGELLLELFSEEIPVRMQARAAEDLTRLVGDALAALAPAAMQSFHGPRRMALGATLAAAVPASSQLERGPRVSAPEQALTGFLRKHGAAREDAGAARASSGCCTRTSPGTWMRSNPGGRRRCPTLIRRFPWPKAMRWGGTSQPVYLGAPAAPHHSACWTGRWCRSTWRDGADDGHGLHGLRPDRGASIPVARAPSPVQLGGRSGSEEPARSTM